MPDLRIPTQLALRPKDFSWLIRGRMVPWMTLVLSLVGTLVSWNHSRDLAEGQGKERLVHVAAGLHNRIEREMITYRQALYGVASFLTTSGDVSRAELKALFDELSVKKHFPGMDGIGFAKLVLPADKDHHERQMRADGLPDYAVKPPGERAYYAPIVYLAAVDAQNGRVFGYDLNSEAMRRAAIERARDTGNAALSGRIVFQRRFKDSESTGFLMFVPVFRPGTLRATPEQRHAALAGWVIAPFLIDELVNELLAEYRNELSVEVIDLDGIGDEARILATHSTGEGAQRDRSMMHRDVLSIADRRWALEFFPSAAFVESFESTPHWILLMGVLISLSLFSVTMGLATTRARAMTLADRLTQQLRASNDELATYANQRTAELQTVLTVSPIPMAHVVEGCFNWVNPAMVSLLGYSESELIGQSSAIVFPGQVAYEAYSNETLPVLSAGGSAFCEQIMIARDGSRLICEGHIKALDPADQSRGRVVVFIDVTQRRRDEEQLRESERYNRLLFQASPVGLVLCRMDGSIVDVNAAYAKILGLSIEEALALTYQQVTPEKYAEEEALQLELLRNLGHFGPYEKEYFHRDGHLVPVRLMGRMIERGGESFTWTAVQDITEARESDRRIAEYVNRIEQQNRQLEESARLKTEFLNNMSHELKTPLHAIIGFSELLTEGIPHPLDPEQRVFAQDILAAGRHLFDLIDQILTYSRGEDGPLELRLETVNVAPFLEARVKAFSDAAQGKGITVSLSVAPECDAFFAEPDYLRSIVDHLLSNAVKFTLAGGRVAVGARLVGMQPGASSEDLLEITVADNGIGISAHDMHRVFQPFMQADATVTRHVGGAGIGLALAQQLAKLHGGEIVAESEPGAGSIFKLILPWRTTVNQVIVE
jgi:PAS domain S-box-containing protein